MMLTACFACPEQWYPATVVMYRPRATTYNYLIHFDDGWRSLVGLPDPSVRLLRERVTHCMCARCCTLACISERGASGTRRTRF